jgi:hypothetical protein
VAEAEGEGGVEHGSCVKDTLERMRANPSSDWTVDDINRVCRDFGARCSPPSGGGSHFKISHPTQRDILTIPVRRPIKPVYIRKFVRFIDGLRDPNARG